MLVGKICYLCRDIMGIFHIFSEISSAKVLITINIAIHEQVGKSCLYQMHPKVVSITAESVMNDQFCLQHVCT